MTGERGNKHAFLCGLRLLQGYTSYYSYHWLYEQIIYLPWLRTSFDSKLDLELDSSDLVANQHFIRRKSTVPAFVVLGDVAMTSTWTINRGCFASCWPLIG